MHIEIGLIAYSGLVVGFFFAVAMVIGAYGLNKLLSEDSKNSQGGMPGISGQPSLQANSNARQASDDWRNAA